MKIHHHDPESQFNGKTRGPPLPRNFVCTDQPERLWQQFFGTQKVFYFWNSCHTRQPLLETPMPLHENIKQKHRGKSSAGVLLLYDNAVKEVVTGYFDTRDVSFFLRVFDHWRQSGLSVLQSRGITLKINEVSFIINLIFMFR